MIDEEMNSSSGGEQEEIGNSEIMDAIQKIKI